MGYLREYVEGIMRGEKGGIVSSLLFILSLFYGLVQKGRAFLYKKGLIRVKRIGSMVISIGNITVGGTGKTPAVIAIAEVGKEKGFKVAILTRGYGGKAKGINPVTDGTNILLGFIDAGDEPYLMAKKLHGVSIVKGKDRHLSARLAMERFGSNLFILDDGFQHLKLNRDMNILLIDATDPFGNGYLFPRGILREPLTAMRRADIVVLTKSDMSKKNLGIIDKIRRYNPSAPIFFSYYRPLDLVNIRGDIMSIEDIKGKALFLFSGLASPSSFRPLVERYGARIISELTYPDHFYYSKEDIDNIKEKASGLGADMLVTTEKDIVRIPNSESQTQIYALRIEFVIEDKERWEDLLFRKGN
jgi:tetraacyldisaccharide 4'-kinase